MTDRVPDAPDDIPEVALQPDFYNGINFETRLHARYAEFFDVVALTWEYPPEWHTEAIGQPMFWLPDQKVWVYVVNDLESRIGHDDDLIAAYSAFAEATVGEVYMLSGPVPETGERHAHSIHPRKNGEPSSVHWIECAICAEIALTIFANNVPCEGAAHIRPNQSPRIMNASERTRTMRFDAPDGSGSR